MMFEKKTLSFLNSPIEYNTENVTTQFAFIGIPYGPPYTAEDLVVASEGADAVRQVANDMGWSFNWEHMNFDTGQAINPGGVSRITDCGDIPRDVQDPEAIWDLGIETIRPLAKNRVVPLVVGGLDSIPPIVAEAFSEIDTKFNVLHVDAHLDFREERYGQPRGFSSPIRRIREIGNVNEIVQVGLRSMGSARVSDVEDAIKSGNRLVTAWDLHEMGAKALLDSLSDKLPWLITIDCDGLDPSIAPGVGWPEPGGLDMFEIGTLVRGLAKRNSIMALVFTEFQPELDVRGMTARTIGRLMMNVVGLQSK